MSSNDFAVRISNISKCYEIYASPSDRLKQFLLPKLRRWLGLPNKKYFSEFWAVQDITLEVKKGETVGIIGRNGSGKSTLLQIICGTLTPTNGIVETKGRIAALLELGSGFNPEFTGRDNIYMNASVLGLTREETEQRFDLIVNFAEIGDFIDRPVKTYSSGMLVRLAFAVIAHVDADILVIDEALAVGDAFFSQKCMLFLRNFMKNGTVLFVSHDTGSVKSLCSHATWIDKGKLICSGSPKDVCEQYLEAFYENQQGKSVAIKRSPPPTKQEARTPKDQRIEFLNGSNLRNDLKIFDFDADAASFGKGGAHIFDVSLLDENGSNLSWIVGGEKVTLHIAAQAHQELSSPIIGFYVKDRSGQTLFGDNTFLSYCDDPISCDPESHLQAGFSFSMPILPAGDYSISVAIADGTQENHVQHHWIHDALFFKSESSSVVSGLVGLPMHNVVLEVLTN